MAPPASRPSLPPAAAAETPEAEASSRVLAEDQTVPLRLTASRGSLGLELYAPVDMGPLTVSELSLTLPGLKFPLDLSGGVPKFRHRRGELERLMLRADLGALARFASRRLDHLLDHPIGTPMLFPVPGGIGVGGVAGRQAFAFELLWAPSGRDARFVVANARGAGLEAPALAVALRAVDSVLGPLCDRKGRVVWIRDVGQRVGRLLLPAVGARVPASRAGSFGLLHCEGTRLHVLLDSSESAPGLPPHSVRALELAGLLEEADDRLALGNTEGARKGYVFALERAPRHPEITRLVAEIDARIAGRSEAALGLLVESLPATQSGLVGAELLAKTGDLDGARQAIEQAVRNEPFAPVAALQWLRLAELDVDSPVRVHALDRAVAAAPGLAEPRWARFLLRVARGDPKGAVADAEHLEAIESGARARHDVCRRAARALLDEGHVALAGRLFERALRYLPDDATATSGLARALLSAGHATRALALFERAVELAERAGQFDGEALIDLARGLAEAGRDLPQAIARLRQVSAGSDRVVEARHLEGAYRARLGDRVGAALAFARMREAVELAFAPQSAWAAFLVEAAENSLRVDDDPIASERHLSVALRLQPTDDALGTRYREVAELSARRLAKTRGA